MEIIMKVKCSPNPGAGSPNQPSLKIVDQHHQLQQHTNYTRTHPTSPQITTYSIASTHNVTTECPTTASSCAECNVGYCCNLPACCITSPNATPHHLPTPPPLLPLQPPPPPAYASSTTAQQQQTAEEQQPPEFVSIDDEKVKEYLMKFGQQQLEQQRQQQLQKQQQQKQQKSRDISKITRVFSVPSTSEHSSRPVVYEIIELDDESEREKLKQIKQQAEQRLATNKTAPTCIDINYAARHTKSLNISLIPKTPEVVGSKPQASGQQTTTTTSLMAMHTTKTNDASNHKIIAEISLIESSDDESSKDADGIFGEEEEDLDDDLPLVAVSCELECDDEDDSNEDERTFVQNPSYSSLQISKPRTIAAAKSPSVVELDTRDEENDEHLLARWEEYEGQRERVFFECFLCGKKVQSSYNLRRHMMIHTGERPFGCDMCDRRFREFSDLKKHRRRHTNEPNFLCMICREYTPMESDSTRCINCCTQSKNAVLEASIKLNEERHTDDVEMQHESTDHSTMSVADVSTAPAMSASRTANFVNSSPPLSYASATTPPVRTTKSPKIDAQNLPTFQHNSTSSEDTQRLLDNIPAVHRPGYNQLGKITRKEFPCPLCNRAFGTRHNLKRHYMIHTGEKPFSCTKCRKPFREYSTLKKHMVTHQRDRWYKCMQCPMKYRDFLKYIEHKETHANTEGDSDEQTSDRSFSKSSRRRGTDSYMDSNEDDSNSDDWLECCECNQRFSDIDAYNEHVKEHARTYQCYMCKDQFEMREDLEQHLAAKHRRDMDSEDEDAM